MSSFWAQSRVLARGEPPAFSPAFVADRAYLAPIEGSTDSASEEQGQSSDLFRPVRAQARAPLLAPDGRRVGRGSARPSPARSSLLFTRRPDFERSRWSEAVGPGKSGNPDRAGGSQSVVFDCQLLPCQAVFAIQWLWCGPLPPTATPTWRRASISLETIDPAVVFALPIDRLDRFLAQGIRSAPAIWCQ